MPWDFQHAPENSPERTPQYWLDCLSKEGVTPKRLFPTQRLNIFMAALGISGDRAAADPCIAFYLLALADTFVPLVVVEVHEACFAFAFSCWDDAHLACSWETRDSTRSASRARGSATPAYGDAFARYTYFSCLSDSHVERYAVQFC